MKRILLVHLLFIPFYINAQIKEFHVGMKLEFYAYTLQSIEIESIENESYTKRFTLSPYPSLYFLFITGLSESMSLIFKPGLLLFPEEYEGFEFAVYADYNFSDLFFLNGGINMHIPPETAHGVIGYEETSSSPVFFVLLGAGYRATNLISIDIAYHYALNPEFGFVSYRKSQFISIGGPLTLNNMLKLGIAINY
jgi:hypothetical protein